MTGIEEERLVQLNHTKLCRQYEPSDVNDDRRCNSYPSLVLGLQELDYDFVSLRGDHNHNLVCPCDVSSLISPLASQLWTLKHCHWADPLYHRTSERKNPVSHPSVQESGVDVIYPAAVLHGFLPSSLGLRSMPDEQGEEA